MKLTKKPRQSGRRTSPSRPRSRICQKKRSLVKRVASILRRRRSHFRFVCQSKMIEMAENILNLPHEGKPGLIYAVPEVPNGHSRQSLIDIFDDVVASMSASTTNSSSKRSWETYQTSRKVRLGQPMDLLTGEYDSPEDFDRYLAWQPLDPRSVESSSKTNGKACEPAELTCSAWSAPRTPARASSVSLIDLDSPTSTGPSTPPDAPHSHVDELFFGGVPEALKTPPLLPSPSLVSLDAALYPRPLNFKDSPYPVLKSTNQTTPNCTNPQRKPQKQTVHSNLKLDSQHPGLHAILSPSISETPTPTQPSRLTPRKPVQETQTRYNQRLTPATPTSYLPHRPTPTFPSLPPVPAPSTASLLDEINSEIDKMIECFNPAAASTEQKQHDQPPSPPRPQPTTTTTISPLATRPPRHPIHIPPRTTSRAAPTTASAAVTPTTPHAPSSFRSRLGASTLDALLRATDSPSSPSSSNPSSSPTCRSQSADPKPTEHSLSYDYGHGYSWHRFVDGARDPDSETEEREYSRRWRERRRGEKRGGVDECEGGDQCESQCNDVQ